MFKEKFTNKEIEQIKEMINEYKKLKKCLAINTGSWDYETNTHELVQSLDLNNPIVKELSIVARKVDMILDNLGLKYNETPSLLKMKKCIEGD